MAAQPIFSLKFSGPARRPLSHAELYHLVYQKQAGCAVVKLFAWAWLASKQAVSAYIERNAC